MAKRQVLKMGHPVLRQKARELSVEEIKSPWFEQLIADMVETMHSEDGVGIAAPQIGESVRVSVIEFQGDSERYPDMGSQSLSVFINPIVKILESETEGFWEGCLSVPGLRGYVERPRKISIEYLDIRGIKKDLIADGFLAIVLQHEFDHLDGILYIDRVKDPTKLAYLDEYRQFVLNDSEVEEV
jgi:peptide deformylase